MKVVTISNAKGGVGKTALTAALALEAVLGQRRWRVLAFDADPQATLASWADETQRQAAAEGAAPRPPVFLDALPDDHAGAALVVRRYSGTEPIRTEAATMGAQLVLIDCKLSAEARDPERGRNALRAADLVLVPIVPAQLDLLSQGEAAALLASVPGARVVHVLSRALRDYAEPARRVLQHDGLRVLQSVIHERRDWRAFASASAFGEARRPRGEAGTELRRLFCELEGLL